MNPAEFAAMCLSNQLSVIPIRSGSKQAAIKWEPFQQRRMTAAEIKQHFRNGCQVALVGGAVSGDLECLDFDKPDLFPCYRDTLESVNPTLKARLTCWQETPSGGYHILYRCSGPVGGNQKLAMSARYKDDQGRPRQDVFIETRGEGGYFLVAPSQGYTLNGNLESIPVLSPDERDLLHAIARSFDEAGQQAAREPVKNNTATGDRPGDRFNRENDWQMLLEGEGWRYVKTVGNHQHWCRPGKGDSSTSATLNEQGLFVFSSSTPLPVQRPLDKFAFYTYSRFIGDFTAAAQSLRVPESSGHSGKFRKIPNNPENSEQFRNDSELSRKSSGEIRVLAQDVLSFIESDPAPFSNNDIYTELCARNPRERKTVLDALYYYEKQGKIKKIDGKRGCWEVVETEPEVMDLLSANAEPFNILLPLDISDNATVRPGSIILVSGSSNAGKTVFLLTIVRNVFRNTHIPLQTLTPFSNEKEKGWPPRLNYLNSEMSAGELATRIKGFGDEPTSWVQHVKFIERAHSFDKLVDPDGVTFIDFLEVNEDFYQAGKFIADIHRRLKNGVAVVAMQKKQGHAFAKGGEMTLEKPRLAINLDKNEPHGFICKIAKCKEPVDFMHSIQGMERDFVITGRSEILPVSDWRFVNEPQRKAINAEYARTNLPDRVKRARIDYRTGEPLFTAAPEYTEEGAL